MKNTLKVLGMIAIITAIIFSFAACGDSGGGGAVITYTVTFNSNGGTAVSPISGLALGSKISEPTVPKKGYAFEGWHKEPALTTQWVFASDTVTANITLYAKWGAYDGSFSVGETGPGGGKIFYKFGVGFTMTDDSTTAHYMEASPVVSTSLAWASGGYVATLLSGTFGTEIGTGRKNTALILAEDPAAPAAKACKDYYAPNNLTDWFLPSKDELDELYTNQAIVDSSTEILYWSSSQSGYDFAWWQRFVDGWQHDSAKANTFSVRAIRAF